MNVPDSNICLFFELIRVSIGHQDRLSQTPTEMEWRELYALAEKQTLIGICFCGVQRLQKLGYDIPTDLYMKWLGMAAKIQQRNELMNRKCVELQRMLTEEGMKSCILKGQGVARLYDFNDNDNVNLNLNGNLGAYRQSGDIDVWVDASKEWAIDYVMKTVPTREFDQKHIHFRVFDDVEVEVHWIPVKRDSPKFDRIL